LEKDEIGDPPSRLEEGLAAVRATSTRQESSRGRIRLARLIKFAVANWVLLSFLAALATALYVKLEFGVEYFREYRSIKEKRDLSAFYTHLGDVLLNRLKWREAETAYLEALQNDPNNFEASKGTVKAQVFSAAGQDPMGYDREIADIKLRYLLTLYPKDAQLLFMKGLRTHHEGDPDQAICWYRKALVQDPNSAGSYAELGFIYGEGRNFSINDSIENLQTAARLDPDNAETMANLGYMYLVKHDLRQAGEYLTKAVRFAPTWEKDFELAEWNRYAARPKDAALRDATILNRLEAPQSKDDPYLAPYGTDWNFMPLGEGDITTIRKIVKTDKLDEKKAFVHYALSLDYAMMENFRVANEERDRALKIDVSREYAEYFSNISQSVLNLTKLSNSASRWFNANVVTLIKAKRSSSQMR
jgi:tetratricopeptide (TPR) repeat protein